MILKGFRLLKTKGHQSRNLRVTALNPERHGRDVWAKLKLWDRQEYTEG